MNILFVDDEPNVLRGLKRTLRSNRGRWNMHFAEGGKKALEVLEVARVDVLVTDMRMPGFSGGQLAAHLRERHPEVLCIGLSGYCKPSENLDSPTLFHQFWSKPCRQEFVVGNLERIEQTSKALQPTQCKWLAGLRNLPTYPQTIEKLVDQLNSVSPDYRQLQQLTESDIALHAKLVQLGSSSFCGSGNCSKVSGFSGLLRDQLARQLFARQGLFRIVDTPQLQRLSQSYHRISKRAEALTKAREAPDWMAQCAGAAVQLSGLSQLVALSEDSPFAGEGSQACHNACRFLLAVWGVNPTLSRAVEGALEPFQELVDGTQPEHFTSLSRLLESEGNRELAERQLQHWGLSL